MIQIDKKLIQELLDQAVVNPRLRQSFDLRNSEDDGSQRLLYALMPGTKVNIHRHPNSNETFVCLCGKIVEVICDEVMLSDNDDSSEDLSVAFPMGMDAQDVMRPRKMLKEKERYMLDPSLGNFGCVVPAGAWHTVEVLEPSVILEAKDGKYGEDGSETLTIQDKGLMINDGMSR